MAKSRVRKVVEYVTRDEFGKFAKSVDLRFDAMDKKFDDLIAVLGETIANAVITIENNLARRLREELGADLARQLRASEERLRGDLARDIVASEERIRTEIRGVDDQYRDLPERLTRLEEHTGIKR